MPEHLCPILYPFDVPRYSYRWSMGRPDEALEEETSVLAAELDQSRVPVLAIGSNAAPLQLKTKFDRWRDRPRGGVDTEVPVMKIELEGFDIVYAAHMTHYGALPATLLPVRGTVVTTMVTWFTYPQLNHINSTEALGLHYALVPVPGARLSRFVNLRSLHESELVRVATLLKGAVAYVALNGSALLDGDVVALATIEATDSPLRRHDERSVLRRLAQDMRHPEDDFLNCDRHSSSAVRRQAVRLAEEHLKSKHAALKLWPD